MWSIISGKLSSFSIYLTAVKNQRIKKHLTIRRIICIENGIEELLPQMNKIK